MAGWIPCLVGLVAALFAQAVRGENFLHASTADAAAAYKLDTEQFSRQRLTDQIINVGGQGGSSGFLQAAVFPFQLPDFGAVAEPFENARFLFRLSNKENTSAFNVDLYGLPPRSSSAVLPASASTTHRGDFFMGGFRSGPPDDDAPGVVKIQDNILVPSTPTGLIPTGFAGSDQLAAYLNAAYDGGSGAGKWVFLRLGADALTGGAHRYAVSSADNPTPEFRPRIRYNYEPGPEDYYLRIGSDPTFQELIDSGVVVPGVAFALGPVLGSQILVNHALLEQQTGPTGPIPQDFRIHTQVNSSILRSNFPNFTRWYQEDGNVLVMRLFEGEQNVRSGVGPDGTPGRIEAFFPTFTVQSGTWSVWEGTYTIIEPLGSTIFQLFHDGGQLWPFHLRMTSSGSITFNRRRDIAGLPKDITIATDMVGKSIRFMVRGNGTHYELYKKIPQVEPNWQLVTTGHYTPAVDNKISFRWGMYVGSQQGQSVPKDGLLFVTNVQRYAVAAPGGGPPPPPPRVPVTYYWDTNDATPGFGAAGGVWSAPTTGGATQGWTTDPTGETPPLDVVTYAEDPVFFGTASNGLGAGTITVENAVNSANIVFGAASGNITLDGGEIGMSGSRTITVAGTGRTHTIRSVLAGAGSRTIDGGSTLVLSGQNTFSGPLFIGDNTSSSLGLRINSIANADGTPSAAGAPATAANGIIQLGAGSHRSTLELRDSTSPQATDRRIRVGWNGTGSGTATILNNNTDAANTLTFTNPAFNVAATDTASFNRTLTLGGSNTGDNTIQGAIVNNIGGSGGQVRLAKSGSGTWVLTGASTYSGTTTISAGTLALIGAGVASPITVASGASLGFATDAPATSASSVDLTHGTVHITGAVDGVSDYLLITAAGITGTPILREPIPGYALEVRESGTRLVLAHIGGVSAFDLWSGGAAHDEDSNGDGVSNALAWALGAAGPFEDARGLLPTLDITSDPDYLIYAFHRGNAAEADPYTIIAVDYSTDLLAAWTPAVHDGDDVIIEVADGSPADAVVVKLKRLTLALTDTFFVRLKVTVERQ